MTDHEHGAKASGDGAGGRGAAPIDSEIDVRRAIEIALWLVGTTVGTLIVGYFIYLGLAKWTTGQDPAPSPLTEANRTVPPPAPNLQIQPEKELAAMLAAEHERLTTWGWTDKSRGLARMPIEEAIDRLAVPEPALPAGSPAPAAPPTAPVEPPPASAHEAPAH